jgi:hypothetical protein
MLAQILPGFRDFRAPLVTGYLWLLAAWILLGKPLPSKARKDGLLGMVNALTEYLSGALMCPHQAVGVTDGSDNTAAAITGK